MSLSYKIVDLPIGTSFPGRNVIMVEAVETAPGTTKTTTVEISLGKKFKSITPIAAPAVLPVTSTNLVTCQCTEVKLLGAVDTKSGAIKLTFLSGVNESIVMRQPLLVEE